MDEQIHRHSTTNFFRVGFGSKADPGSEKLRVRFYNFVNVIVDVCERHKYRLIPRKIVGIYVGTILSLNSKK